jgi:hypothetical protein
VNDYYVVELITSKLFEPNNSPQPIEDIKDKNEDYE